MDLRALSQRMLAFSAMFHRTDLVYVTTGQAFTTSKNTEVSTSSGTKLAQDVRICLLG